MFCLKKKGDKSQRIGGPSPQGSRTPSTTAIDNTIGPGNSSGGGIGSSASSSSSSSSTTTTSIGTDNQIQRFSSLSPGMNFSNSQQQSQQQHSANNNPTGNSGSKTNNNNNNSGNVPNFIDMPSTTDKLVKTVVFFCYDLQSEINIFFCIFSHQVAIIMYNSLRHHFHHHVVEIIVAVAALTTYH